MRQLKGIRKSKSLYQRAACLKYLVGVFQKHYITTSGPAQKRFEDTCKHVNDVIVKMAAAEPQKKSFYMNVIEDLKNYLLSIGENEALIKRAAEAAQPIPGEVGTVNV